MKNAFRHGLLLGLAAAMAFAWNGCRQTAETAPDVRTGPAFADPYELNRAGCRVGVLSGCDSETISRKIYNRAEIVAFASVREAAWQLMAGKIDGFVYDEHVLRLLQWRYPQRFRILEAPVDTDPSVIAVSSARPDLRDRLNRFIARIRADGTYDEMFLRWCHDPERRPDEAPAAEDVFVQDPAAPVLRVGVDPVQEPNAYFDRKGRLVGYDVEFACRFGRAEKARVVFVEDEEAALLRRLEDGELDVVIANLGKDRSRKGVLWTDGYLDSDIMMMVREP